MHRTHAIGGGAQNGVDTDLRDKVAAQSRPKIFSILQLARHQPAAIKRSQRPADTGSVDLDRTQSPPAELLCNGQFTKRPRRPGKKPFAGKGSEKPAMLIAADQYRRAVRQRPYARRRSPMVLLAQIAVACLAKRKIHVRGLLLPDNPSIAALVVDLDESCGNFTPAHFFVPHFRGVGGLEFRRPSTLW